VIMDIGNTLFITKKVLVALLTPPGIFVVALLVATALFKKRARWFFLILAALLYVASIEPAKDALLLPLENAYPLPSAEQLKQAEAYVVLGGGIVEHAPDPGGKGSLTSESLERTIGAYRLYRLSPKPVILTGGKTYQRFSETEIAADILLAFGVKREHVIFDPRGRDVDTQMNAQLVRRIATHLKMERIVLITSPFHMKRSVLLFRRSFKDVIPFPAGYKTSRTTYRYKSFLPESYNMHTISLAVKEYLGIIYYSVKI
jgi:uncharacterized SAM-binding protein YcdF (DUF218 family)